MRKLSWREVALDAALIFFGSLLFAFGLDCFEIPNGLAAGGIGGCVHQVAGNGQTFGLAGGIWWLQLDVG